MWKREVRKDIRKMRIVNWRQIEHDRDVLRRETEQVLSVLG